MGGVVVIPLVGLVFPIALAVGAVAVNAAVITWAAYRLWHDRERHTLGWFHRS